MTATQIVLLVVGILAFNGLVQGTIWTLVFRKLRRIGDELPGELAAAGDPVLVGPERVSYAGATKGDYPRVRGMGILALTERRVVFVPVAGKRIEVPVDELGGAKAVSRWKRSGRTSYRGGRKYLVLSTHGGADLGFSVKEATTEPWLDALRRLEVWVQSYGE